MASGDGQTNSQWRWSLDILASRIRNSLDHENQNKGDQRFDQHRLCTVQGGIKGGYSQVATSHSIECHLYHSRSSNGAHALDDDVEGSLQNADLTNDQESKGDRRINVTATEVAQAL